MARITLGITPMDQPNEPIKLSIRRATHADVPAIVRLLADDVLGSQRERYHDPLPQTYYAAFSMIESDQHQELVVVEVSQQVIGTLQLSFLPYLTYQGGLRAQIEAVRVDQQYRSHGVGQYLFEWAINRARQKHCHMVQLTTNAQRADAQRFYEHLGFIPSHIGLKLELQYLDVPNNHQS